MSFPAEPRSAPAPFTRFAASCSGNFSTRRNSRTRNPSIAECCLACCHGVAMDESVAARGFALVRQSDEKCLILWGFWWPRPDSNRHSGFPEADFKSIRAGFPHAFVRTRLSLLRAQKPLCHRRKCIDISRHSLPPSDPATSFRVRTHDGHKAMHLTNRTVAKLPTPAHGNRVFYDDETGGFGCRVTAAGSRAFILNYYRRADGRERRFTIGAFPDWSVAAAHKRPNASSGRSTAVLILSVPIQESRAAPTIADLVYPLRTGLLPAQAPLDATSLSTTDRRRHPARPWQGQGGGGRLIPTSTPFTTSSPPAHQLTPIERLRCCPRCSRWRSAGAGAPTTPVVASNAIRRKSGTDTYPPTELTRLSEALAKLDDVSAANAVRLLLLTGARRGELLGRQVDDIEHRRPVCGSNPGPRPSKRRSTVSRYRRQRVGSWPRCKNRPIRRMGLSRSWRRTSSAHQCALGIELRKAAGIPDPRLHDLRHTFATALASSGLGLPVIGALLGHTTAQTTLRYAHQLWMTR